MLLVFLGVVAGVVLATLVVGAVALRRLYQVPRSRQSASPRRLKIPFSTEKIPAGDRCHLAAWFFPASTGQAPGVVLLHGWGKTAESLYPLVAPLHQAGLATLLIDARHHGASDAAGRPSLRQFAEDMTFALDWLAAQTEVDNERLFALGHSIGARFVPGTFHIGHWVGFSFATNRRVRDSASTVSHRSTPSWTMLRLFFSFMPVTMPLCHYPMPGRYMNGAGMTGCGCWCYPAEDIIRYGYSGRTAMP